MSGDRTTAHHAARRTRKAYLDGRYWGIHYFRREEILELLNEAGFEPAIHHAKGLWMIAGGVRRG
jgi:hypothetical protein